MLHPRRGTHRQLGRYPCGYYSSRKVRYPWRSRRVPVAGTAAVISSTSTHLHQQPPAHGTSSTRSTAPARLTLPPARHYRDSGEVRTKGSGTHGSFSRVVTGHYAVPQYVPATTAGRHFLPHALAPPRCAAFSGQHAAAFRLGTSSGQRAGFGKGFTADRVG